jgi:hypothetical protein
MEQKMCDVVYDAELKKEFEELENKSEKRCDHPLHGGKDAADCVANIAWFLTTNEPIDLVNNFVSINTF